MILSILLGWGGTIIAFFSAAFLLNNIKILLVVAFCAGFLIISGGAWIAAKRMKRAKPGRTALSIGVITMLILALAFAMTVNRPLPSITIAHQKPPIPSGVRYWDLNTGSHIAYLKIPAHPKTMATPIIMVGGGPGEEDVTDRSQTEYFSQLAQLGYDVYFYDQIGSGLSARLKDPGQYTLARHVADLEAIRAKIGAKKVILMGASWGGTLVANYMAAYPQHVTKAIFTSPAPIDYGEWPDFGSITSRLQGSSRQRANRMFERPRFLFWYLLGRVNPKAAHNLISDEEADAFFNTFLQRVQTGTVCDPAHAFKGTPLGNGFYDNIFTTANASSMHEGANPRKLLASDHIPSLIMTGACNYIKWAPTWQYRATLPDSTLLYFPHAGHEIYRDQPDLYMASIRAFLLGIPLPLQPWTTPQPPNTLENDQPTGIHRCCAKHSELRTELQG